jgi:outer membrane protein TolC
MRRIAKLFGIVTLSLAASSSGHADDLVTILQIAFDNDPTLRQSKANYRANRENMLQSRSALLPSLNASVNTSRLTSGPTDSQYISGGGIYCLQKARS